MIDPRVFAESCLCLAARRASRVIGRAYDEAFRPLGITSGQFTILMLVSADRPTTVGLLADALAMDSTTATAALKPLIRDELVGMEVHPDDRRARLIRLTHHGRRVLERAIPLWRQVQSQVTDAAGSEAIKTLRSVAPALQ